MPHARRGRAAANAVLVEYPHAQATRSQFRRARRADNARADDQYIRFHLRPRVPAAPVVAHALVARATVLAPVAIKGAAIADVIASECPMQTGRARRSTSGSPP